MSRTMAGGNARPAGEHTPGEEGARGRLSLRLPGAIGAGGCLAALIADGVGILVHPHFNPKRETISDLAAGRQAWIADAGLYAFAIGLFAVAWGLWRLAEESERRGVLWRLGCIALAVSGVVIAVMAVHGEYGDREPGGIVIHAELVYAMAALFLAAPLLLLRGLATLGTWPHRLGAGFALGWLVLAPPFVIMPTAWDGLYERFIALLLLGFVGGLSLLLLREGRRRTP